MSTTNPPKHVPNIPYTSPPTPLQTLDIWLPQPPPTPTHWLIYIHGGAWRDPLQTSWCAHSTASHIFSHPTLSSSRIAGIASLNYRLSPYPSHPTQPSTPSDAHRNAVHPAHVQDVRAAISFLGREYSVRNWVGVGHSCGASLLCQFVGGIGVSGEHDERGGPEALVLSAGIYSLPLLVRNHSVEKGCGEDVAAVYETIVKGAFGGEERVWEAVSPVSGRYGEGTWRNGKMVVLAHSVEDELVEREQRDVMCGALEKEGWRIQMHDADVDGRGNGDSTRRRTLQVRDTKGRHDFAWRDGKDIAQFVLEVVQRLTGSRLD